MSKASLFGNPVLDTLSHQPTHTPGRQPFHSKEIKFPLLHLSPDLFLFFSYKHVNGPRLLVGQFSSVLMAGARSCYRIASYAGRYKLGCAG